MNEWWHEQDQDDAWIQQQEAELQQYEESEGPLFADGFRDALIGIGYQFNQQVAIYDYAKCVYVLERQGMTREEALEYMEFNVTGAYMGRAPPVFLTVKVGEEPRQMSLNLEMPD